MFYTIAHSLKSVLAFCIAVVLAGCVSPTTPQPVPAKSLYSDAFAYCAAVGTIDIPDQRYRGPEIPDSIVHGMIKQGIVSADAPPEFQQNAVWRCMNDSVWVCHFGANLPCLEKADTSQAPNAAMEDFCKTSPTAASIPAAVTGRATVYAWRCTNGKPGVIRQLFTVDPQGYLTDFWHELPSKIGPQERSQPINLFFSPSPGS